MWKSLRTLFSYISLTALCSTTVPIEPVLADSLQTERVFQNQLNSFGGDTTLLIQHARQMGYDYVLGQPWNKKRAQAAKAAGLAVLWNSNKEYPKYVRFNGDATRYNIGSGPSNQGWPVTAKDEANFNNMFCMKQGGMSKPLKDRFQPWKKTTTELIFLANMQCRETPPLLVEYNVQLFEDHGGTAVFDGLFIDGVGEPTSPGTYWYTPCYNTCLSNGADYTQRQGELEYIRQMDTYFIDQLGLDGIAGNPWKIQQYNDAWPVVPLDLLYNENGKPENNDPASWGNVPPSAVSVQMPYGSTSDTRGQGGTHPLDADYPTALAILGPAGASGAWFGWYGESLVEDSTNSTQLARAIPNWDNLVGATNSLWDPSKREYRSSNSYANPNIIYGRHAKTGKIFAVFQNTQGVLTLRAGEVVTNVKRVDSIFRETVEGQAQLAIAGTRITLVNSQNAGKGYILTTTNLNHPPIVHAGADQTVTLNASVQLAGSGSDADGDPITAAWSIVSSPSGSHATLSTPKAFRSTFVADRAGQYTIQLTVNDGKQTSTDTIVITIATGPNRPPGAHSQTVTTAANTAVNILLTGSDPDGDSLTFRIKTPPSNGTLSGLPPQLIYTPKAGFSGSDSFIFYAEDGQTQSLPAKISIIVTPLPHQPSNLILNPSFEQSPAFTSWTPLVRSNIQASFVLDKTTAKSELISAKMTVQTSGGANDLELSQSVLVSSKTMYRLSFWAKASIPRDLVVTLIKDGTPWDTKGLWKKVKLSQNWQKIEVAFTYTGSEPKARLAFRMGDQRSAVWLDAVTLTR